MFVRDCDVAHHHDNCPLRLNTIQTPFELPTNFGSLALPTDWRGKYFGSLGLRHFWRHILLHDGENHVDLLYPGSSSWKKNLVDTTLNIIFFKQVEVRPGQTLHSYNINLLTSKIWTQCVLCYGCFKKIDWHVFLNCVSFSISHESSGCCFDV